MWVVIFRATINQLDPQYTHTAEQMRRLALEEFGCTAFHAASENGQEIAISYWPSEQHIKAWKNHPEHLDAQRRGRESWYADYDVHIAEVSREYRHNIVTS